MRLIFWLSLGLMVYVYVGYPLMLVVVARRRKPPRRDDNYTPSVSMVIAAHNEEKVLREKIENSLRLDYQPERLEIIVASDGSEDGTNTLAREYADRGVTLHEITPRGGKTRALNLAIPRARGEILVLSDANTMYRPDAVRRLVRHFVDHSVGAVSGDVQLVNAAREYAASESLYYRYERWLQVLESRLGSIIGADGAMYALRREAFAPVPPQIIVDDFVISMNVACAGYRVIYEPEAIAVEQGTLSSSEEYGRKVRIVAGGIHALFCGQGVPGLKQPRLLWCYVSHKLLRWLMPLFLLAALGTSAALSRDAFMYQAALITQVIFYAAAVLHRLGFRALERVRGGAVPYYFCLVNGAALTGLWRALKRTQAVTWRSATR